MSAFRFRPLPLAAFVCLLFATAARPQGQTFPGGGKVTSGGTNGGVYRNAGGKLFATPTGGAGTLCWISTNGGVPVFGSCAGSTSTLWSALTTPTGNLSLTLSHFTSVWTYDATTGSSTMQLITDTASNTGTGILWRVTTASGSGATPWQADANGVGWKISTAGALTPVGGGTLANGSVANAALANASILFSVPTWLTMTSTVALGSTATVGAATGQTSHQVIGTCGSATSFAPCALVAADIPTLNQDTTGKAGTATALAANPANCATAGTFPNGVDASGVAENCTPLPHQFFGTSAPGSVSGNLPGDEFSDTTNHNVYKCLAPSGTAAPACTAVTAGGWTLQNGAAGSLTVKVGGVTQGTRPNLNLISANGITQSCADNPGTSSVDCSPGYNPALIADHDSIHANENYCASSNGTTGYTCLMPNKALPSYAAGQAFLLNVDTTCASSCTLNIDGLGTKNIKKKDGTTDPTGALVAGQAQWVWFDGTIFRLMYL